MESRKKPCHCSDAALLIHPMAATQLQPRQLHTRTAHEFGAPSQMLADTLLSTDADGLSQNIRVGNERTTLGVRKPFSWVDSTRNDRHTFKTNVLHF